MKYWSGRWNCIVAEAEYFHTGILNEPLELPFVKHDAHGGMIVRRGFPSDGASFPVLRRMKKLKGPAVGHDAGYALLRAGFGGADRHEEYRQRFDLLLHDWCDEVAVWNWLSDMIYKGVRFGGGPHAKQRTRKVHETPEKRAA